MKKKGWLIVLAAILLLGGLITYLVLSSKDEDNSLTLLEKRWIESNKTTMIDFGILNNVAILNNEGDGIFFDFLTSLEDVTELDFNKVSYSYGDELTNDYTFDVTKKVDKKDILVYTDNYVVLSKNNVKYNRLSDVKDLTLGVLKDNEEETSNYLNSDSLTYKTFETTEEMIADIDSEESTVDAIVMPKLIFLSNKFESVLYVNYNIVEMQDNYVIKLGSIDKLNDIIRKYYSKWKEEHYDASYAKYFTSTYFDKNAVDEQEKAKFRSKRYTYGFVDNLPFDTTIEGKLLGTNSSIISDFSKLSNVEISYKEYDTYAELLSDFNANKIDFYFDIYMPVEYKMNIHKSVSSYDEQIVIASDISNPITINSINSLKGRKIATLNSTKTYDYLKKLGADVTSYNSMEELLKNKTTNTVIAIDALAFDYYSTKDLKNYKVDFRFNLDSDYNYVIRNTKENKIFMDFFDYYLSFNNEKELINVGYYETVKNNNNANLIKLILIIVGSIAALSIISLVPKKLKNRAKKNNNMKKEDKLRYVDMLTSLKNRNYLNENVEIWDESEVYPQTIIIVDLNNVAYINDNYGHQEGDNIIKEAANILITNQLENSDIIRTNGNEFLIYLVEYDEKQVVAYIRKLNKCFKELTYGFGAAIGYSMINDAIKTIDDAINEATLDMRNNKQELNN